MPRRLVVLVSGEGTLLQQLIEACATGTIQAEIVAVGPDRDGTLAAKRAEAAGLSTFICRVADFQDRAAWDEALASQCASFGPDLVISAGFGKLFGPAFLAEFSGRCINSHPALLPSFPGLHAVRDALRYGVTVTGCTLFFVDGGVDSGPVIAQVAVDVRADDDEVSLTERIKQRERDLLVNTVAAMVSGGWSLSGRQVIIGGQAGGRAGEDAGGRTRDPGEAAH